MISSAFFFDLAVKSKGHFETSIFAKDLNHTPSPQISASNPTIIFGDMSTSSHNCRTTEIYIQYKISVDV